jgi:hypothetical protein
MYVIKRSDLDLSGCRPACPLRARSDSEPR